MIQIAILGFGTVGSGVAEVLLKNTEKITSGAADSISLKYILDIREFPESPFAPKMIQDFSIIEKDPDIHVVVETIGGVGVAYEYTKRCLLAGKSVVTSNKELVAAKGYELLSMAQERNLNYLFEASVGGGIPILRPISQCLAGNEIDEIYGILNGTTNYILTRMRRAHLSFDAALKEAQEKGFAEADPRADIEGDDACRKICILGSLSFGHHIYPHQVPTEGISKITPQDTAYARSGDKKIKLFGRAIRLDDGKVAAYVAPHLISRDSILANVEDEFNGIVVHGNAIGSVMFCGAGAGMLPTASAVVADVIDCAKHMHARKYVDWSEADPKFEADPLALVSRWYVRMPKAASPELFGQIEGLDYPGANPEEQAFLTPPMSQREIAPKLEEVGAYTAFRVLD